MIGLVSVNAHNLATLLLAAQHFYNISTLCRIMFSLCRPIRLLALFFNIWIWGVLAGPQARMPGPPSIMSIVMEIIQMHPDLLTPLLLGQIVWVPNKQLLVEAELKYGIYLKGMWVGSFHPSFHILLCCINHWVSV